MLVIAVTIIPILLANDLSRDGEHTAGAGNSARPF
jgi:hypothetical protein